MNRPGDLHNKKHVDKLISVLTLNIRFGLAGDGANSWQYRKKTFPSLLNKYCNDFVGFQEANDFQIDFLKKILTEYNCVGQRDPAPPFWQNNIIFYKKPWQCTYCEHFFLSPTPVVPSRSRKSRWPRQCTLGVFKNNDCRLICINTHFDFNSAVQVESARLIMDRLTLLPADLPVILFGDFNSTPSSSCHAFFTGACQTGKPGRPFFKNVFKKPFPATHHGFTGDMKGDHIDWILYSGRLALKSCVVIQCPVDGLYPSDHFPVRALLGWTNQDQNRSG